MDENQVLIESYQAPLFAKMARVMGKMSRLEKRGHNDHFNYDYATSEDVSDLVRQAMSEENISFFVNILETQRNEKMTKTVLQFVFADGETGATYTCRWESEATDSMDKGISKAVTSGVKYFLLKTFLISTGDEPDPDGDEKPQAKVKKEQPEAQKKQPSGKSTSTDGIYQAVVDAGLSENAFAANETLSRYCRVGFDTPEKAVNWMRLYRGWRDKGDTSDVAAEHANKGEVPK